MDFPKLLVVTEFPPNGSPPLHVQYLKGYPADRIYWWSCKGETSRAYGQQYARHYWSRLPLRLLPGDRYNGLKCFLLGRLWAPHARRHLLRTFRKVKPDQVWVNLYGWDIGPVFTSRIAARQRTHATIWDFPDTQWFQHWWGAGRCRRALARLLEVYRQAASRDAVSEPMREELAAATGCQDIAIAHSGLEAADIARLQEPAPAPDALRIAYAGAILFPEVIENLVSILATVRRKIEQPICLEFFGREQVSNRSWFDPSWMHAYGDLPEAEFNDALGRCSWGLVTLDLEERDPRYTRFSLPNKVGTYLAGGLPILLLARPEAATARLLERHPVGVLLDRRQLLQHLLEVFSWHHPRARFLPAILAAAQGEFSLEKSRAHFWRQLGVKGIC